MELSSQGLSELRTSGVSFPLKYVGFVPVTKPAHEMTQEACHALFAYATEALCALREKRLVAVPSDITDYVDNPVLRDLNILFKVSAKTLLAIHDDQRDKEKVGRPIHRHPMKFTAMIQQNDHRKEYFAYISKNSNGMNRRCCVFSATSPEAAKKIMDTLDVAMALCNNDDRTPCASPHNNGASTSEAPTPTAEAPLPPPRSSRGQKSLHAELVQFPWYHGVITRHVAESRLEQPGDFLIRESENNPGQVVLSGIATSNKALHLLLVNDNGKLSTDEGYFDTIESLVNYYLVNRLEIHMDGTPQLFLRRPIARFEA